MTIAAQVRSQHRGLREVRELRVLAELDPHLVIRGWLRPDDLVTLQRSVDRSIRVNIHHLAMESKIEPARERQPLGVVHAVCCRRASCCQDGNRHNNRDTPERLHHPPSLSNFPLTSLAKGARRSLVPGPYEVRSGCGASSERREVTPRPPPTPRLRDVWAWPRPSGIAPPARGRAAASKRRVPS